MEINPLSRMNLFTAYDTASKQSESVQATVEVVKAVRALNKSEMLGNRELLFSRDADTRTSVIKIVERSTGEVLEQIPPEQVLQMMATLMTEPEDTTTL